MLTETQISEALAALVNVGKEPVVVEIWPPLPQEAAEPRTFAWSFIKLWG